VFVGPAAGRPEEDWHSKGTIDDFAAANEEGIGRPHDDGLLSSIAWVEFVPDSLGARVKPYDQSFGMTRTFLGKRPDVMEGARGGTREVPGWDLAGAGENPVYTQLEERVRETGELRDQLQAAT
jgi:hypothetical protein